MGQDTEGVLAQEAPQKKARDVSTLPDGSGNDRDADHDDDDERFDAG